jgi:hypothetical protein
MARRCNLAEVEGDGVASLCEIVLWAMRIRSSRGGALGGFIDAVS